MRHTRPVSVLFTRRDSIYKALGFDSWDIDRNAVLFTGSNPVVCHPPCAQWSRLRGRANPDPFTRSLAPWSICLIRKNGGVLEHPEHSLLWTELNLPLPGQRDAFGGFTLSVNQSWFGHPCRKRTFLYVCGITPDNIPDYPVTFHAVEYSVCGSRKDRPNHIPKKEVAKSLREHTPQDFAIFLTEIAKRCKGSL